MDQVSTPDSPLRPLGADASPDGSPAVPSAGVPSRAVPNSTDHDAMSSGRSARPWVVAGIAVGVVGAAVAVGVVVSGSGSDASTDTDPIRLQAVAAETRDLVQATDLDGTMRYAAIETVTGASDGVVTAVVEPGTSVARGDIIAEVDAVPVTVAYGSNALYRTMQEGVVGDDVLLLERHLSALGYQLAEVDDDGEQVDEGFVVDGDFDRATTEAVERWQEDLGLDETGVVDAGDLAVLAGPSLVTSVPVETGDAISIGAPLVEVSATSVVLDGVATNAAGDVVVGVTNGQTLASGDVVYAVDGLPRTAVVTDVEFERDIEDGIDAGDDVRAIEEMLAALGHDADGTLVVDDVFDDATEVAITAWEENARNSYPELDVDGAVDLDQIVVVAPGVTVGEVRTFDTSVLASGTTLWTSESDAATRLVETSIAVADQDQLAVGDEVDIEFPDGETVVGAVESIATSSTVDPAVPDAEPTLAVEISLAEVPASVVQLTEVDVTVKLVEDLAEGVVTVPASALVALGDGEFAVEQVIDGGTQFVAVETGMFSDGFVEVTGIDAGTQVVIPS